MSRLSCVITKKSFITSAREHSWVREGCGVGVVSEWRLLTTDMWVILDGITVVGN